MAPGVCSHWRAALVLTRFTEWWATARSSLITHRRLKWLWIASTPAIVIWFSESIKFLVFISVYAVIVGHWSSEEAAKVEVKAEEAHNGDASMP